MQFGNRNNQLECEKIGEKIGDTITTGGMSLPDATKKEKLKMKKRLLTGLAIGLLIFSMAGIVGAATIIDENFEGVVGSEWSSSNIYTTPTFSTHGNTNGLGRFGNQTITLSLNNLAAHNGITISFELYLNDSWDGNHAPGPDYWSLKQDSNLLLHTTFSNIDEYQYPQSYPDSYSAGIDHPAHTGAAEYNNSGGHFGNSVYDLCFSFQHVSDSMTIEFTANGLQSISDESWGLDNVIVSTNPVPVPAAVWLFGSGLIGLIGMRKKVSKVSTLSA